MSEIPTTYEDWKHCIEVKCGIRLSKEFCEQRIQELVENKSHSAISFTKKYGEEHTQLVISWYKQALKTFAQSSQAEP